MESDYDSSSESEFGFKDDMNFDASDNTGSPDPIREIREDIAWIDSEFEALALGSMILDDDEDDENQNENVADCDINEIKIQYNDDSIDFESGDVETCTQTPTDIKSPNLGDRNNKK